MSEKITGVCVDIPTIIAEAKAKKEPFEWSYKIAGITFDADNLSDAEKFLIEKECQLLDRPVPSLADIMPSYYKNQRFAPAPEWISVTDRLPEEKESVNVYVFSEISGTSFVTSANYYWSDPVDIDGLPDRNGKPYPIWMADFSMYDLEGVTHWMPLPDPPKRSL